MLEDWKAPADGTKRPRINIVERMVCVALQCQLSWITVEPIECFGLLLFAVDTLSFRAIVGGFEIWKQSAD